MSITRIEGDTWAQRVGVLFICSGVLADIWEGDFSLSGNSEFTVCLKERRTGARRPVKEAIKLHIPRNFVRFGVKHELSDGTMESRILTWSADNIVKAKKLHGKHYWCWLEVDA